MSKYIDEEALIKKISLDSNGNLIPEVDAFGIPVVVKLEDIKQIIREMPVADVEPRAKAKSKIKIENGVVVDGCNAAGEVVIPQGVTKIGSRAFNDCGSLIFFSKHILKVN